MARTTTGPNTLATDNTEIVTEVNDDDLGRIARFSSTIVVDSAVGNPKPVTVNTSAYAYETSDALDCAAAKDVAQAAIDHFTAVKAKLNTISA